MIEFVQFMLVIAVPCGLLLTARVITNHSDATAHSWVVRAARSFDATYRVENRSSRNYRNLPFMLCTGGVIVAALLFSILATPVPEGVRYGIFLTVLVMTPDAVATALSRRETP